MAGKLRLASAAELRGMNEKAFLKQVVVLARHLGWRWYHTFISKGSDPGFPDLVLVRQGFPVIFAELKSERGKLTESQAEWITLLSQNCLHRAFVWRPSDWDEIVGTLQGGEILQKGWPPLGDCASRQPAGG
jgi:hypothetical protein